MRLARTVTIDQGTHRPTVTVEWEVRKWNPYCMCSTVHLELLRHDGPGSGPAVAASDDADCPFVGASATLPATVNLRFSIDVEPGEYTAVITANSLRAGQGSARFRRAVDVPRRASRLSVGQLVGLNVVALVLISAVGASAITCCCPDKKRPIAGALPVESSASLSSVTATLQVPAGDIKLESKIGANGYGIAYRASWNGSLCTASIIAVDKTDASVLAKFNEETQAMKGLRHPNIIPYLCYAKDAASITIVTELIPTGSLHTLLDDKGHDLSLNTRMSFILDVCKGMAYLHDNTPPILHKNLRTTNIIVDSNMCAKVADFGLADVANFCDAKGETIWDNFVTAPEVYAASKFSKKSDVYALGIIVWEVIEREDPFGLSKQIQVSGASTAAAAAAAAAASMDSVFPECAIASDAVQNFIPTDPMLLAGQSALACPSGMVTFVSTDVEGAKELWQWNEPIMKKSLQTHNEILRTCSHKHNGYEVMAEGDAFMLAFPSTVDALQFCVEAQESLLRADWDPQLDSQMMSSKVTIGNQLLYNGLRARMGVHVGMPHVSSDCGNVEYSGPCVEKAESILSAAAGGQIIISSATKQVLEKTPPLLEGMGSFLEIGPVPLKDEPTEEVIHEFVMKDLNRSFVSGSAALRSQLIRAALSSGDGDTVYVAGKSLGGGGGSGSRAFVGDNLLAEPGSTAAVPSADFGAPATRFVGSSTIVSGAMALQSKPKSSSSSSGREQGAPEDNASNTKFMRPESVTAEISGATLSAAPKTSFTGDDEFSNTGTSERKYGIVGSSFFERDPKNAKFDRDTQARRPQRVWDFSDRFQRPVWLIDPKEVVTTPVELGKGSFGAVFKGEWRGQTVAVKRFFLQKVDNVTRFQMKKQLTEIHLLGNLRHPAIVRFSNLIHRDLKSANILMNSKGEVKLSDFGLAAIKKAHQTMTLCGTVAWMAPEVLSKSHFSEKSDVYSFGMVMFEIMARTYPFKGQPSGRLVELIVSGKRPSLPVARGDFTDDYVDVMTRCWSHKAEDRPLFKEIAAQLPPPLSEDSAP
eukprot:m51a1_g14769 putative serine threonine-protein kinase ctr1 (1040) ;mRNA; f:377902-382435